MPTYKGNVGHLVQHWTLCELLNIAQQYGVPGLNFIDAHAMAPIAYTMTEKVPAKRRTFESVRANLSSPRSVYERAWRQIAPAQGYPNSANFVQRVWEGKFSMLLCEKEPQTVAALKKWLPSVQTRPKCKRAKVVCGDWRERLGQGIPRPDEVDLPLESLTLVSFDPYMYNSKRRFAGDLKIRKKGNLYPDDLWAALVALRDVQGPVLLQLSTYDTNDGNSQRRVEASVSLALDAAGFRRAVPVRFNGKMVSFVSARGLDDCAPELAALPASFRAWYDAI